jgi:hypothetical protein
MTMNAFNRLVAKVREINGRYRQPRIEMSGAVRLSLMALRIYLLLLVCLMVYKFVTIVRG